MMKKWHPQLAEGTEDGLPIVKRKLKVWIEAGNERMKYGDFIEREGAYYSIAYTKSFLIDGPKIPIKRKPFFLPFNCCMSRPGMYIFLNKKPDYGDVVSFGEKSFLYSSVLSPNTPRYSL